MLEIINTFRFTLAEKIKPFLFKLSVKCNPNTFYFDMTAPIFPWESPFFHSHSYNLKKLIPFLQQKWALHLHQPAY